MLEFNKTITKKEQKPVKEITNTNVSLSKEEESSDVNTLIQDGINIGNKLSLIAADLKNIIIERDDLIDDLMIAIATGNHALMLGVPGVAKSLLAREITKRITEGKYFEWLLNKTSDPSEILGPFSIKALENDKFLRKTEGKLPEANIAFLDETFKCNAPVLNNLLSILNERLFFNDGNPVKVPLISMIGASNEEPEDDSLAALYDRLLFRFYVDPIKEPKNRAKMYDSFLERRSQQIVDEEFENTFMNVVSIPELLKIRKASRNISIPRSILNKYDKLLTTLSIDNIEVSDRRKNEALGVLQGSAIVSGREYVTEEDFKHLIPVLWQRKEDISKIEKLINEMAFPFRNKVNEIHKNIRDIKQKLQSTNPNKRTAAVVESKSHINQMLREINELIKSSSEDGTDTSELIEVLGTLKKESRNLISNEVHVDEILGGLSSKSDIDLDDLIDID